METNEELRAKYNPEGSDLRRAQLRMLDMLLYLDKVCKENEITYWLAAGTCLGAVRHGGFIPWDDDIDIFMMENEYKKLIDLILSNPHPQFKIQIKKTDSNYFLSWAKLRDTHSKNIGLKSKSLAKYCGLTIDIFPLSDCIIPKWNSSFLNKNVASVIMERTHSRLLLPVMNIFYYVQRFLWNWAGYLSHRLYRNRNYLMMCYGFDLPHRYDKDMIFPLSEAKFEGYIFPVPGDIHRYLTYCFGNYVSLPAQDKRNCHNVAKRLIW